MFGAVLDGADAAVCLAAVEARADADRTVTDIRTPAQRRADALVAICTDSLFHTDTSDTDTSNADPSDGERPARGRRAKRSARRHQVNVTVPWHVLLALSDEGDGRPADTDDALGGRDPARLDGHTPLDPATARRLATRLGAEWRFLITDSDGRLATVVEQTYRPSRRLAEFIVARDRTCRFPGCDVAARLVDIDHIVEWALGGPTTAANLHPLCRRHHRAKTFDGWSVTRDEPTGYTAWTSPTGRRYDVPPAWIRDRTAVPTGTESATCGSSTTLSEDDAPPF